MLIRNQKVSIPVKDLTRARRFFIEKLGQTFLFEDEYAVVLGSSNTQISLVPSKDAGKANYSLVTWLVENIDQHIENLRRAGIQFEEYDFGNVKTVNGKAKLGKNYVAWFKDSEDNLLAIAETQNRDHSSLIRNR